MALINLLSGLSQGYAQGQQDRLNNETNQEFRKLQVKMFQRQLDMQDEQKAAAKQFLDLISPVLQMPTSTTPEGPGSAMTGIPGLTLPGRSLKDVLNTPEGQAAALKAGHSFPDIKKFQQLSLPELMASLQTQNAVGNPPMDVTGATNPNPMSGGGGLKFSGLEVDSEGNPKLKFDTSTVKNWALSPDGKTEVGYDQLGRPIAQRIAGADKRMEEDKPLGVSGAKDMMNNAGLSPAPTMSMREAVANGYRAREDKVQLSDAARLSLANEGAKNLQQVMTALVDENGKVRKSAVLKMDVPGGGIGEGRELNQLADTAIAGQILLQSGVSVRPEEIESLRRTYIPTMQDFSREGLAERKLERFKALLEGNIDMASLPPSIKARVEQRRSGVQPKASGKYDPLGIR